MIQMIPSHHNRLDTSSGHKVIPKCGYGAGPLAVKPKGQLISKCLFGVFNSSKKQMKTIRP